MSKSKAPFVGEHSGPHGVYLLMTFSNYSPDSPVAKETAKSEY